MTLLSWQVEENLAKVRNAGTEQDLGIQYKALKPEVDKLNMMAAKRQQVWFVFSSPSSGYFWACFGWGRGLSQTCLVIVQIISSHEGCFWQRSLYVCGVFSATKRPFPPASGK